jgi:uncharacterized membrane protein
MAATLTHAFTWWSSYYGDHQALSVTIRYLHLAALVVGGGTAIATDRQVRRAAPGAAADRAAAITMLNGAHGIVGASLALIVVTGVLMTGADLETYLTSWIFWTKMGLVALLLVNGAILRRAGQHAASLVHPPRRLVVTAVLSIVLWLVIVYTSSWLMVAA